MALNTVTVTWSEIDPTQSGVGGTITFTLSTTLTDATDTKIIRPVPQSYPLAQRRSQPLIANDNSSVLPTGSFYMVQIQSADGNSYNFSVTLNFANGAVQDLSALVPLVTQPTMVSSLPLPSGTPVAGDVPIATGVGEGSAWGMQGGTLTQYLAPAVVPLTFGTSIAVNAALGNEFAVTLTASTGTLATPSNPVDGQAIRVRVIQGSGGSFTLAYTSAYDFGAAGAPTLSTAAGKVDILGFEYVASLSKWCYLGSGLGF